MKIIVSPNHYEQAIKLINEKIDGLIIGQKNYANKVNYFFNDQEVEKIIKQKQQTKVFILINRFFFESEIAQLENYLKKLNTLNIDGVIFNDLAIAQITYEQKLNLNLIYDSLTLFVNYGQIEFYQKNQFVGAFMANELKLNEVTEIIKNKNQFQLFMQVSGHVFIMESKWKLISSFMQNDKLANKKLYIQEASRNHPCLIYQDDHGTYMHTKYVLSLIKHLKDLKGVDYFVINSIYQNDQWVEETVSLYQQAISHLDNQEMIKDLSNQENKINQKQILSEGFIGNLDQLIYLERESENE